MDHHSANRILDGSSCYVQLNRVFFTKSDVHLSSLDVRTIFIQKQFHFTILFIYFMTNNTNQNPKQILATNNHYTVLGIHSNSSVSQIKRAYREMALRYHPDKNDIPQAKQIFNKIVNAYNVLSNQEMRIAYDEIAYNKQKRNFNQPVYQTYQQYNKPSKIHTPFRAEYSETFNQKHFQKNMPKQPQSYKDNTHIPKRRPHYQERVQKKGKYRGSHKENYNNSLAYFLLIVFFTASFLFSSQKPEQPNFLFTPNDQYTLKMKTNNLKTIYFVKADHDHQQTPISEQIVQRLYIRMLEKQCQHSLNVKKMYQKLAEKTINPYQKDTFLTSSRGISLKSCKKIVKLLRRHPRLKLEIFENNVIGL